MEMKIVFPGGKKVDAVVNGFTIRTDQSRLAGGEGSAPEPFTLFLASIGTCAGIYVLGFCQQRGIPTEGIELVQRMEFDPVRRMIGKVRLDIQVPADFPEKYHQALVRAAEQCAVKRHLEDPPEFEVETTVKDTVY
ncbi:MAG: osmotically inducible protein OsmC [Chlorobi bacterium]|nr:osmotically inducible protein OsmC [Chlorobiota bacterium]